MEEEMLTPIRKGKGNVNSYKRKEEEMLTPEDAKRDWSKLVSIEAAPKNINYQQTDKRTDRQTYAKDLGYYASNTQPVYPFLPR